MRNAIEIGNDLIVTTDNSGGIGEKVEDIVFASDRVTAYFAARVTLLEQWSANAEPMTVLIHNFSGSSSWENYVQGVVDLFQEVGIECPEITGSTETNMELVQSAVAVTMIGKKKEVCLGDELTWFTYGTPLVGNEVMERSDEIASMRQIHEAIDSGIIDRIWPVGSRGIENEARLMTDNPRARVKSVHDVKKSAGPATVIFVAIQPSKSKLASVHFGSLLNELHIEQ